VQTRMAIQVYCSLDTDLHGVTVGDSVVLLSRSLMGEEVGTTAAPSPAPADPEARHSAEPKPASPAADPAHKKRSAFVLVGQVGAGVSTVATIVGLVLVFAPGLKPDPPAAEKGAVFSDIVVEAGVTRADYLRRLDRSPGGYTRQELRRRGAIVAFHVSITGHKGEDLPLRWGVYSAGDGAQVYREKATTLTPEAAVDEASSQVWTPLPPDRGPYYVLFQLFEEDELVTINQAKSASFPGLAGSGKANS
jgi:hypothetical protein